MSRAPRTPATGSAEPLPAAANLAPPLAAQAPAAASLDPDLARLTSWTLEDLALEIQAQRQQMAELSDFLQVLQDDNHVKDPAFATSVLECLHKMEHRLERWEAEFARLLR